MEQAQEFLGNSDSALKVISSNTENLVSEMVENTKETTRGAWRRVSDWITGFPQRFDDFQRINGSFRDIFIPKR